MKFHMIDVIYAALPMHTQAEKMTFSWKDNEGKSLHVYWSRGKGLVYPAQAYTTVVVLVSNSFT